MTPDLSRRLGRALNQHLASPEERARVVDAAQRVEDWEDLPEDIQELVEDIEVRPGPLAGSSVARADLSPDDDEFEHYWTAGEGLGRWLGHPHEWRTLRRLLAKHPRIHDPAGLASTYFHKVKGFWPGADLHRVEHGKPPRGDVVGPG